MRMEKEYRKRINQLEKENSDLKVVIDTAQSALRSVDSVLKDNPEKHKEIFTTSALWVLNYQSN